MSNRLALADAIEDAGISREKATRISSVISDAKGGALAADPSSPPLGFIDDQPS